MRLFSALSFVFLLFFLLLFQHFPIKVVALISGDWFRAESLAVLHLLTLYRRFNHLLLVKGFIFLLGYQNCSQFTFRWCNGDVARLSGPNRLSAARAEGCGGERPLPRSPAPSPDRFTVVARVSARVPTHTSLQPAHQEQWTRKGCGQATQPHTHPWEIFTRRIVRWMR